MWKLSLKLFSLRHPPYHLHSSFVFTTLCFIVLIYKIKACVMCWRIQKAEITHCRLFTWDDSLPLTYLTHSNNKTKQKNLIKSFTFLCHKISRTHVWHGSCRKSKDVRSILMCGVMELMMLEEEADEYPSEQTFLTQFSFHYDLFCHISFRPYFCCYKFSATTTRKSIAIAVDNAKKNFHWLRNVHFFSANISLSR